MTVCLQCDYCGQPIGDDDLHATIYTKGRVADDSLLGWDNIDGYVGHFHTRELADGDSCYCKVADAIWLAMEYGPTLETIPVATGQSIAHKRRKHRT